MKSTLSVLGLGLGAVLAAFGQAVESAPAYLPVRAAEPIAWGETVDGLSVGIGAVRAFHGEKSDLVISAYLANRASVGLWGVIRSQARFVIECDGQTYDQPDFGGPSGDFAPGEIFPPLLLVSDRYRSTARAAANKGWGDMPSLQVTPGRHSIRILYRFGRKEVASPVVNVDVPKDIADLGPALPALTALSGRPDPFGQEQSVAIEGLRRLPGELGVAAIARQLKDPFDSAIRSAAARTLAEMKSKGGLSALSAALSDPDRWVRISVAQSLGELGDRDAIPTLKARQDDADVMLRYEVLAALVKLGEPVDLPRVAEVIRTKSTNEFQNGIWLIKRNAPGQAVRILISCLDFNDPSVSSYYNYTLVTQIESSGGPKFTYRQSFDGKGTAADVAENRRILDALRAAP